MRIVSTSPSITETLFALGLGDRVVGVSTYCRFPPETAKLPKVGTFLKPDAELIAGLRPDLVLVHEVSNGIDRQLASLRIPFAIVERGRCASVFSSIRQIAAAAGVPDRGDSVRRRHRAAARGGARRAAQRSLARECSSSSAGSPGTLTDLVAVGPGSYFNDLIEIAGGRNVLAIAGQPEYPRISMEAVLRFDPDVIVDTVDMGETEPERHAAPADQRALVDARTRRLAAVKTGRLHAATTDALVVPGPRVVDAAEWVAGCSGNRNGDERTAADRGRRVAASAVATCCRACRSTCARAKSSAVMGATAPARARCSTSSPDYGSPRGGSWLDRGPRCRHVVTGARRGWSRISRNRCVPDLPFLAGELVLMGRYPHTDRWFESDEDRSAVEAGDAAHRLLGPARPVALRR